MRVRTEAAFPQDWADTQLNLGLTYEDLTTLEDAQANRTAALACFVKAERGYTACGLTRDAAQAKQAQQRVQQLPADADE